MYPAKFGETDSEVWNLSSLEFLGEPDVVTLDDTRIWISTNKWITVSQSYLLTIPNSSGVYGMYVIY